MASDDTQVLGYIQLLPEEDIDPVWLLDVMYGNHEAMLDAMAEWCNKCSQGEGRGLDHETHSKLSEFIYEAQGAIAREAYDRGQEAYESWVKDSDD